LLVELLLPLKDVCGADVHAQQAALALVEVDLDATLIRLVSHRSLPVSVMVD
jgi:hypothetical protein